MMGRRTAAMLCVLLGHALLIFALRNLTSWEPVTRRAGADDFVSELVDIPYESDVRVLLEPEEFVIHRETPRAATLTIPSLPADAGDSSTGESGAITQPGYVDWPQEGKDAAARVLAREAEAERIAKMFAGPQGTWASLTKRQQSELNHFRWKAGVDGLERDEKGNTIFHLSDRCVLVNFLFIGCALGAKPPAYGDLFKDMRLYFDEQRLPQTNEGNGREPESMRPPKWSKPLP
jgi:hypothetical protein